MITHTSAKIGVYRPRGCGDIMVLVCDVISQDCVTKGLNNIMDRRPSRLLTILTRSKAFSIVVVEM